MRKVETRREDVAIITEDAREKKIIPKTFCADVSSCFILFYPISVVVFVSCASAMSNTCALWFIYLFF